jgi:HAD superfamily hydrolase (TIGR01509 family)
MTAPRLTCEPLVVLIELVIFDCDGVLVDSEPISNASLARALTGIGLPTSADEALREYKGLILGDVVARAQARLGGSLPDGFLEAYERDRETEFRRSLRPVPHAREVVEQVRAAGLKVCVASQGKLEKTELTLGLTGLRSLFSDTALFSAHSVARGKPFPDLFLHAAATMRVRPEHCLVVEDTSLGARAATAAGMRVVGYAEDDEQALALGEAGATVIRSLPELLPLLATANGEGTTAPG